MSDQWQSRIVGHGRVRVDQIVANPRNWRLHPKYQTEALRENIHQIGFVRSVLINQRTGYLVDGHDRVWLAIEEQQDEIDAEYVELSDEEEAQALATLDPISAIARADAEKLTALLADVHAEGSALKRAINDLKLSRERHGINPNADREQWLILVTCADEDQQRLVLEQLSAEGISCRALIS